MNEVASVTNRNTEEMTVFQWTKDPELIEAGAEIRGYYQTAKLSYLQIGKKLTEVKDRFEHGEWENFLQVNAGMSVRTAQTCMQAYQTYGFDTRYIEIGQSKGITLLPLPESERERLMAENDVKNMSVRDLKKKIDEIREQERLKAREAVEAERVNGQIQLAKAKEAAEAEKQRAIAQADAAANEAIDKAIANARAKVEEATARANDAEKRAFDAESRPPELVREPVADPALVAELENSKAEIERLIEANRTMMESMRDWNRKKAEMQAEIDENNEIIREQQGALNDAKNELLNMKSAAKRGDERMKDGEEMTLDTLQRAVREFMGWVVSMPQMHGTFSRMAEKERRRYREQVDTVRAWAADTMKALETVDAEGGYTIE